MQSESTGSQPRQSWRDYIGVLLGGFAMGICEIIPGVSGGTMAFILGIYEELINAIKTLGDRDFLRAAVRLHIRDMFRILNWKFLLTLGVGMGLAIISLARLLTWILENYPVYLWSFFFGLVVASVVVVSRRVKRWSAVFITLLIVAALSAYWLVGLVPAQTPNTWWFLMLSGALASCAMILPGVSGSFILVLLGKYETVLHAVSTLDIGTLFWVGLGAALGLITFARVVSWLFRHYHNVTVAVLTGLMLGSLRKIWPWKESLDFLVTNKAPANILPPLTINGGYNYEIAIALLLALGGMAAIVLIERIGQGQEMTLDAF